MSGVPILTVITVLPLAGAVVALFAGKHARGVALITSLLGLALALFIWTQLPGDGTMAMVERAKWAPSLGIEYHLGVDGLGALMLVLSAIVTLMSVDAAHRVHRQPGLYFALVLVLESGLFGAFTALNFFHWFIFWELSLIPAFFLIKLRAAPNAVPRPRSFSSTPWPGRRRCWCRFSRSSLPPAAKTLPAQWTFFSLRGWLQKACCSKPSPRTSARA